MEHNTVLISHRYIGIPTDVALKLISSAPLSKPLNTTLPENDSALQTKVVEEILKRLEAANRPIVIVDGGEYSSTK